METTMTNMTLYESQPNVYQLVIHTDDIDYAVQHMNTNSSWLFSDAFLAEVDGSIKSVFNIENDGQPVKINDFI